jgi:hypothetical protein
MATAALKPTSLADLKKNRTIVARGPSGNIYKIRPLNLERHALAGALPPALREIASKGADAVNELFVGADDDTLAEKGKEVREYLDELVRQVIVEPNLEGEDLDLLPPVDYRWAAAVAMNEEERDGEGRLLWGTEPLSRWDTFRSHHNCPTDCENCNAVLAQFRVWNG